MSIIIEVAKELLSMFLADARLTGATLVLVVLVAALPLVIQVEPLWIGGVLLFGCVAILIEAAIREARIRRRSA